MGWCSKVLMLTCILIAVVVIFRISQSSKNGSCVENRLSGVNEIPNEDLYHDLRNFPAHGSLSLPFPSATLYSEELLQQKWVRHLRHILLNVPRKPAPVFTVTCSHKYRDVLLNWLIAAKTRVSPPLSHVIVFSLDEELWELLTRRGIPCIYADPKSFIKRNLLSEGLEVFYQILVLRTTAIRLLNHWGYDAANIDTDAVVLRNPEPLFSSSKYEDSDLVASYGKFPYNLKAKWGVTMCGGFFLIRSSAASGKNPILLHV